MLDFMLNQMYKVAVETNLCKEGVENAGNKRIREDERYLRFARL